MSDSFPTLIFYDPRFGDTYHIDLDEERRFAFALRYQSSLTPPIPYDSVGDIPEPHRSAILKKISEWNASLF